jgi:hypothetical protein
MNLELVVKEKIIGSLAINYDELKKELGASLVQYQNLVVTEDAIGEAKQVRANLNKVAKVIDDRRKDLKKEFLKPYELVEKQAKELVGMIDEVSGAIDYQVKEFEEKEKQIKKEEIARVFASLNYDKVNLEQIFNQQWLNKGVSLKAVETEINENIKTIEANLQTITSLVKSEDDATRLKAKYLTTLNLTRTIQEYEEEKRREELLKTTTQPKDEVVAKDVEKPVAEEKVEEQEYLLQFEVVASKTKIELLSQFLKENGFKYRKL